VNEAAASIDPYIGPLSTFNIYPPPLTRVNEGQNIFFFWCRNISSERRQFTPLRAPAPLAHRGLFHRTTCSS